MKVFKNLVLTLCLVLSACGERGLPSAASGEKSRSAAHQYLSLGSQWLNTSRPLRAEDLAGRIVLADFWTYCCINCIHIMPDLHRLEQEFGPDLTVIGVHSGKYDNERDLENIRAAVLRYGLEHPIVNDPEFKIWNAFGVNSWPTLILLNPQGEVDRIYSGEGHYQDLRDDIQRLKRNFAGKLRSDPLPLALEKNKAPPSLLSFPGKLAYAPDLDLLFVSDSGHHRILGIGRDGKLVLTIGGEDPGWKDGDFVTARFNRPQGLLYAQRQLYVADTENHLLRQIDLDHRTVSTLAGTGKQGQERQPGRDLALSIPLSSPWDLAMDPASGQIAIAMAGLHQIWSYDLGKRQLKVLAGSGLESIADGTYPDNALAQPSGLSMFNGVLYFVDSESSALRELRTGKANTLIGTGLFDFGFKDGKQGEARLQHPLGLWADDSGIYVADSYNHAIRRYDIKTGQLTTYAGDGKRGREDGAFDQARFNEPNAILRVGDLFYVADTNNHAIRVLDPTKRTVSTLALMAPSQQAAAVPSEKLPNLKVEQKLSLAANRPWNWRLTLPEGWKLNEQAPSRLQLFRLDPSGPAQIAEFHKNDLQARSVTLPPLEPGKTFLLQGQLYYCREGIDALCFLGSGEATITAVDSGGDVVEWRMGP